MELHWSADGPAVLAAFLASIVEFVEALTIVLAVGLVRGWRSALLGTGAAFAVLAALVLLLGPALAQVPLQAVQLVVGTLALLFGLRWLRKAVLRAAGVLPLHDEAKAFEQETAALRREAPSPREAIDRVAFLTSFKIVMLEGIEVVFIVIAVGAGGRLLLPAAIGAGLALLGVVALGLWLHRPLAKVPENTLKFAVGVLLSAFGAFWVGEGVGVRWPRGDWSMPALVLALLVLALALVRACARLRARATASVAAGVANGAAPAKASAAPGLLTTLWREAVAIFVDDGWLAGGVVVWVALLLAWHAGGLGPVPSGWLTFPAGLAAVLSASAMRRAGR